MCVYMCVCVCVYIYIYIYFRKQLSCQGLNAKMTLCDFSTLILSETPTCSLDLAGRRILRKMKENNEGLQVNS